MDDKLRDQILKDNKFEPSRNKPGLYSRDFGDMVVFADFRGGKTKFYGYIEGHPAPKYEVEARVTPLKMQLDVATKGQQRLW